MGERRVKKETREGERRTGVNGGEELWRVREEEKRVGRRKVKERDEKKGEKSRREENGEIKRERM